MALPIPYEKTHVYEAEENMHTSAFEVEGLGNIVGYFREDGELHAIKLDDGTRAWIATGGEIPVATILTSEADRKFLVYIEERPEGNLMHLEEITEA